MDIELLGGNTSTEDARDLDIISLAPSTKYQDVFMPDLALPNYYQGKQPACGGHAGAGLVSFFELEEIGNATEVSPEFVYKMCKLIDKFNGPGTDIRSIFTALSNKGAPKLEIYPNNIDSPQDKYANDVSDITDSVYADALQRVIGNWGIVKNPTIDNIKQAIFNYKAVIALKRPWIPGEYDDGHFVLLTGYDQTRFRFHNSFPLNTSYEGNGTYTGYFSLADALSITEIGAAVDVPDYLMPALTSKLNILRKIAYAYAQILKLKGLIK